PHAINHVVEPTLEQPQQDFASGATAAVGFLIVTPKLPLQDAVDTANLLLFAQLHAVVGQPARPCAMLSRRRFQLALTFQGPHAALQEKRGALAAGELALRANIPCHSISPNVRCDASSAGGSRCGECESRRQCW